MQIKHQQINNILHMSMCDLLQREIVCKECLGCRKNKATYILKVLLVSWTCGDSYYVVEPQCRRIYLSNVAKVYLLHSIVNMVSHLTKRATSTTKCADTVPSRTPINIVLLANFSAHKHCRDKRTKPTTSYIVK